MMNEAERRLDPKTSMTFKPRPSWSPTKKLTLPNADTASLRGVLLQADLQVGLIREVC
jgi:hypothetical protein